MSIAALDIEKNEQTGTSEFYVTVGGGTRQLDTDAAVQIALAIDMAVSAATGEQSRDVEREVREAVMANHRVRVVDFQERIAALAAELEAALTEADAAEVALADITGTEPKARSKPAARGRKPQRAQLAVVKDVPQPEVDQTPEVDDIPPAEDPAFDDAEPVEVTQTFGGPEYRDDEF